MDRSKRPKWMAPRDVPPDKLPMLSPIQTAPKFRPLLARPSCQSLNHLGAIHSAAFSSLAPASAPVPAQAEKATANTRTARGSTRYMSPVRSTPSDDAEPAHDQIGQCSGTNQQRR